MSRSTFTPPVRQALDSPQAEVLERLYEPLRGGIGHLMAGKLGIYRFFGLAQTQDQILSWALVLKAISNFSLICVQRNPIMLFFTEQ
jgi:hypothetical protein